MNTKNWIQTFSALALVAFLTTTATLSASVKTWEAAPEFTLTHDTGTSHNLSDFKSKYLVLEWTNHTCPFVKKFYSKGDMQGLQAKYTAKDVVWLSISSNAQGKPGYLTPEESTELRKEQNIKATARLLDADGKVGRAYGAKTTPHMFVIDPEGTLIYQGAIDSKRSANPGDIASAENYVASALDAAMAGKPVATTDTAPYGCGVKY